MIYEISLTLFSIALLLLLILIYFKKQTFKNARSSAFKILLLVSFVLCLVEILYVYFLKFMFNPIIEVVLYKL